MKIFENFFSNFKITRTAPENISKIESGDFVKWSTVQSMRGNNLG